MSCPSCGQSVPPGQSRCPACQAIVAPPVEGALAAEPRAVTPPPRRGEPIRELPGTRRRERTWKDEVRERVLDRKRQKAGDSDLPLFQEDAPVDDLHGAESGDSGPAVPAAGHERAGIRELGGGSAIDEVEDLPLRPREEPPGDLLVEQSPAPDEEVRAVAAEQRPSPDVAATAVPRRFVLEEPIEAQRARPDERPAGGRLLFDDDEEPAGEEAEGAPSWTLEPPVRSVPLAPLERPASGFERLQAALVDLALLCGMWAVVVYFAGRAAHVPAAGLLPSWPYLGGYLAFLGLTYAAYFTGATGQTLGKIVSGLRVVDTSGQPPGYLRAFLRAAVGALGIALFFGGLVPMFLDPARRALHDRLLRTRVVKG